MILESGQQDKIVGLLKILKENDVDFLITEAEALTSAIVYLENWKKVIANSDKRLRFL